jgi:hypothetical protein
MSAASAAREHAPISDDGGLRTALRNVPLLPAPANVDDLLARLDAEEVPFSSGPLAELISDARIVEPDPVLPGEEDDFFAATSHAANTNLASPLASRVRTGLFGAALLAGALLIGWNALMTPEMGPLPPATQSPETPEVVVPIGSALTGPGLRVEGGEPAREASVASEMIQPAETIIAGEPVASAQPEPHLDPVPMIPDPVLELQVVQPGEAVASVAWIELPEPPQAAPLSAEIAVVQSIEQAPPPGATASPELLSGTPESPLPQPRETLASLAPTELPEPLSAAPDAVQENGTPKAVEIAQPAALTESRRAAPATGAQEGIASGQTMATSVEPEARSAAAPRPVLKRFARGSSARPERMAAEAASNLAAPAPPIRPKVTARAPYSGIWAASPEACLPGEADKEEGHLLTRITASRARAGDASCAFKKIRRRGNVWTMTATCVDGETTWNSDVRLSLTRGRLTWTSQKGSTTYMRCPRA